MLLTDAVQSSRFLTQRMANRLAAGVATLGSRHQVRSLKKHVHVEGRIKMQNESVFHHVDTIHEALSQRRKVAFRYVKYDAAKRPVPQKEGRTYCETPVRASSTRKAATTLSPTTTNMRASPPIA